MVMKTLLTIGILMVGLSGQAFSMGHPHNVFAARKQMRAKTAALIAKSIVPVYSPWQSAVKIDRNEFSERLLMALSRMRPTQRY